MKIFILLYVFISKAITKPFGEFCNWKGDCNDGFICEMEDKIFNPKRICSCPNDLDWVQGGSISPSCVYSVNITVFLTGVLNSLYNNKNKAQL